MLSTKNLVIQDYQHDLILVDNLSFVLNEGDKIAIIGSEGSGKSTLLRILNGEVPSYIVMSGEIIKPSVVAFLDQNIKYKYADLNVIDYFNLDISDMYLYIDNIAILCGLFKLELNEILYRKINTFSGGEAVKIGLIKSLMVEPDVLLLDEPTNDIDYETLVFLENFLKDTSIPLVFISHDQRLLENVATGIIHLQHVHKKTKAKTIFMNIGYKEYKDRYINKFNSDLMIARKQRSDYDKKMEKFRQIYQKVEYDQDEAVRDPKTAALLKKRMHVLKSQERRYLKEIEDFVEIPEKEEPLNIFFQDFGKKNPQKNILNIDIDNFELLNGEIIDKVKLSVKGNDKIAILGKNGSGKSTIVRHINELLIKDNIKVGYISQNYLEVLDLNQTPVEFILNNQKTFDESRVRQILGTLGFKKNEMLFKIKDLSEGTKLKVLLLLITSNDYDVLLLDEPTRNISPLNQDELYNLFLDFKGAIIAVTHDRAFIESVFDDIYELNSDGLTKIND